MRTYPRYKSVQQAKFAYFLIFRPNKIVYFPIFVYSCSGKQHKISTLLAKALTEGIFSAPLHSLLKVAAKIMKISENQQDKKKIFSFHEIFAYGLFVHPCLFTHTLWLPLPRPSIGEDLSLVISRSSFEAVQRLRLLI